MLSHINESGFAKMVDVGGKEDSLRRAKAGASVVMKETTAERIRSGGIKKGDVLAVAQVAGINAAKHAWEIIPMCHMLMLTGCDIAFSWENSVLSITAEVSTVGKTGAEMEALCAVTAAALTVYDMCKAIDRGMRVEHVRLIAKSGGKSGDFTAE